MDSFFMFAWHRKLEICSLSLLAFLTSKILLSMLIRGPIAWPIVGMLPSVFLNLHRVYDWITDVLIEGGGSFWHVGPCFANMDGLITCKPENIEYILRTRFQNFPKGVASQAIFSDLLGEGIFNVDHEPWRAQRKIASLEFNSRRYRQFTKETVLTLVEENLLPVLESVARTGSYIDLQDVLLRYTFDTVCISALGVNPGCLCIGLPNVPFAKAFETAVEAIQFRFLIPESCWKLLRALNVGNERKLRQALQTVNDFAAQIISSRRKMFAEEEIGDQSRRGDLLSCFMKMKDGKGQPKSDNFPRDVAINFILAGRDTSGVALAWFFWLLMKNPHIKKKLLQEIDGVHEKRNGSGHKQRRPFTREELNEMQYLHAALTESLRLYPSVPLDTKQVAEDDVLPDGARLRGGTRLLYSIYSTGRMESVWGKDCLEFRPERWLRGEDGGFTAETSFRYPVFNGGPRVCLGKEMAYLQMKAAAAAIMQRFEVELAPGHPPVTPKLSITLYMSSGLLVKVHPRKETKEEILFNGNTHVCSSFTSNL